MTWLAITYFGVAAIFGMVGITVINAFVDRYPDHELYDDEKDSYDDYE